TVCVVGKMRDLILQLSKSSIYSTKPFTGVQHGHKQQIIPHNTDISKRNMLHIYDVVFSSLFKLYTTH
ncbi:hypothetical protein LPQ26_24950, partial [Klebsiella pneumoniae]|nr:hypothetical protein [Klebsiella pneumoniae]